MNLSKSLGFPYLSIVNADILFPLFVQNQSALPNVFKAIWFWMWFFDLACLLRLLGRFFMLQNPTVVHTFHSKFPQRGLSVTPVMPYQHDRIAYVETMKHFHWGWARDVGCLPSPPYHWHCSCMSDQLMMLHNARYSHSVYYTQHEGSARLWNARAYSRKSTGTLLKVYINIRPTL